MNTKKNKTPEDMRYSVALEEFMRVASLYLRDSDPGVSFTIKHTASGLYVTAQTPKGTSPLLAITPKGLSTKDTEWHRYTTSDYYSDDESRIKRAARDFARDTLGELF